MRPSVDDSPATGVAVPGDERREYRLDELARRAGVASTTVRLYQRRGLLAGPRLAGRTGWYDDHHLDRLRLIGTLQADGHSLAGIGTLLRTWERGDGLDQVIGVAAELDALLGDAHAIEMPAAELVQHYPDGSLTPALMQRAVALGLVEPRADGTVRIPDRRFLEGGTALAGLGVPLGEVLDEWQALLAQTDAIAQRFAGLAERHLAPLVAEPGHPSGAADAMAALAQLRQVAQSVVAAALDASVARVGRERLGLAPDS